jgi:DNA adenine methylase
MILKKYAKKDDLIFLDPPYLPISKYSDFKRYNKEQFYFEDHINLSNLYKELDQKGCHLILTNSNSEKIIDLYKNYKISIYKTKRNINSIGNKRVGKDIIVTNF